MSTLSFLRARCISSWADHVGAALDFVHLGSQACRCNHFLPLSCRRNHWVAHVFTRNHSCRCNHDVAIISFWPCEGSTDLDLLAFIAITTYRWRRRSLGAHPARSGAACLLNVVLPEEFSGGVRRNPGV